MFGNRANGLNLGLERRAVRNTLVRMSSANYRVRRATVEDRPWLVPLWQSAHLPAADLDRRLTEFQVIESSDGRPLGALGLQVLGRHGCVHSEAYADFGFADHFRPVLWERLENLAESLGLVWIWTQEQSPFWSRNGFRPATGEALQSLPEAWRGGAGGWLAIRLREHALETAVLEKHIELLMAEEKQRTARRLGHARMLKIFSTLVAVALAIFVLAAVIYLLQRSPVIPGR